MGIHKEKVERQRQRQRVGRERGRDAHFCVCEPTILTKLTLLFLSLLP